MATRGFELHVNPMRVQIIWFLSNPDDQAGPDLDNITKPFLDGLRGKIIADDQIFGEVHLRKVGINHQFEPEPLGHELIKGIPLIGEM
jgi:Holliday junction resolvase RusA-like endonuclease